MLSDAVLAKYINAINHDCKPLDWIPSRLVAVERVFYHENLTMHR